ncbi:MAG: 2-oxoglutarate dehydrogenase E1 component [Acidiferrobacterales bacterium]
MDNEDPCLAPENLAFLEEVFLAYRDDPSSIDPGLRRYFDSLSKDTENLGPCAQAKQVAAETHSQSQALKPTWPPPSTRGSESEDQVSFLKRCSLFVTMSDEDLAHVAALTSVVTVDAGEPVFLEGEPGDSLYIVTGGSVVVRSGCKILAERAVGEVVGELAVLDREPRSADIIARSAATLLKIRGEDFQNLLYRRGDLARRLLHVLASRVRGHSSRQEQVDQLVRAYRERGHIIANLDPLGRLPRSDPTLELEYFGLSEQDLDSVFSARLGEELSIRSLRSIWESLRNTYCRDIGVQYMHIDDLEIQNWLRVRMEETENRRVLSRAEQTRILAKLTDAEVFESFLHRRFVGAKRFSLEGAESLIPLLDHAIEAAGRHGIDEVVIAMAHRGRLNVLANILDKPAARIFREFVDMDAQTKVGRGDVKYHLGHSSDRTTACGHCVHLSLSFNPSHLEYIGPVVLGRTRAKQDRFEDPEGSRAMAILLHGDAAFAGQGVVQEILNMSELPGYRTGGTVHIILNNQIGFTTLPEQSRSSQYATDVARMLQIPIFHVNGEQPEAVHQVIYLAMEFRARFKKDVVIDMYCYRRYGHNEGDDPSFTQPLLYQAIGKQISVRAAYVENLLKLGGITRQEADDIATRSHSRLEADLAEARSVDYEYHEQPAGRGIWRPYVQKRPLADTGVPEEQLRTLLLSLTHLPDGFRPHRRLLPFFKAREAVARGERALDWGTAEALAFASLVSDGFRVRLSGQDSERGTFSHRHAVCHDVETGKSYTPLQHVTETQAQFEIYNSPLSESGVLGFEYGYSLDYPDALVIWEAQFGDFCNIAQVIVDQFIVSSENKWNRLSGLCLFLPHGFDGQGPEHSSARLERFLALAAEGNIRVVNLTTPAQLFHALRRQVLEPVRKPLVVMSPKALLRHRDAVSTLEELATGRFQHLIPDATITDDASVKRVVLCAGKLYYELAAERGARGIGDIALVRLEQYYPFPEAPLLETLARYASDAELYWVQEEPRNMGAWPFLRARIAPRLRIARWRFSACIAREESASPATGSHAAHKIEQQAIIDEALTLSAN